MITTGAWFGGLVNVLASGNYVRRNTYAEELHIVYALKLSIDRLWMRGQQLLFDTSFIFILMLLLLIGLLCIPRDCKFKFHYSLLVALFFLMAVVIVNYPVFLGIWGCYGMVSGTLYLDDGFNSIFGFFYFCFLFCRVDKSERLTAAIK